VEIDRLTAAADVPGVARVVASGEGWMATTWVDGRTFAHLIETEGPLPTERTFRLLDQLAITVDELHALDIVHGDLSPSNIIVDLHDEVTVIDLGAPSPSRAGVERTARLDVQTTPRYTAPEVAQGSTVEMAADRYALALIAYEALSGVSPFPPVNNPMAMLAHHATTPPVPISERRPSLGVGYDAVFGRGLAKDPEARYPSAGAFVGDLRGAGQPDADHVAPSVGLLADEGRSVRAIFGAGLLLAVVAILVIWLVGRGDEPAVTAVATTDGAEPTAASETSLTGAAEAVTVETPVIVVSDIADWSTGQAAGYACNLVDVPGFEQDRLPSNWYGGDTNVNLSLVPGAGVDGSTALRVGSNDGYGLIAEELPVVGGERYLFSAWVRRQGEPNDAGLSVAFEDPSFVLIEGSAEPALGPIDAFAPGEGVRVTLVVQAPADAAYALPTFFKDGSLGSLVVDEVVFGPLTECDDVPS